MLPQYGNEDEDGGDEDDSQRDLGNGSRGEWLDFAVGALGVSLLVPTRESGEKQKTDKGEDDGNNAEIQLVCVRN